MSTVSQPAVPAVPSGVPGDGSSHVRRRNLALIAAQLGVSADSLPTRASLAATTGLVKTTVSSLVAELQDIGIAAQVNGQAQDVSSRGPGRPGLALTLDGDRLAGLGVGVDVDHITAIVVDLRGRERARVTSVHDFRAVSPAKVVKIADRVVAQALAQIPAGMTVVGATLALPGVVDRERRFVRSAPNLEWHQIDIGAALARSASLTSTPYGLAVDNEANLAALAERRAGAGLGADFIRVSGEIGVGAGIIVDGAIWRGGSGGAGEIGHAVVEIPGSACKCGGFGCLETVAGQAALLARSGLEPGRAYTRTGDPHRSVDLMVAALTAGNPAALAAVQGATNGLATALIGAVNLLDVDTVVLGGFLAALGPWIAPTLSQTLGERTSRLRGSPPRVEVSGLGPDAPAIGAALDTIARVLADPQLLSRSLR